MMPDVGSSQGLLSAEVKFKLACEIISSDGLIKAALFKEDEVEGRDQHERLNLANSPPSLRHLGIGVSEGATKADYCKKKYIEVRSKQFVRYFTQQNNECIFFFNQSVISNKTKYNTA